jgi:WD40 repeat protein
MRITLVFLVAFSFLASPAYSQQEPLRIGKIAWNPQGDLLAASTDQGVWTFTATREPVQRITSYQGSILDLKWSPNGNYIAASMWLQPGAALRVWDVTTLQMILDIPITRSEFLPIAWHPSDLFLAYPTYQGISIWNLTTGEVQHEIEGLSHATISFQWDSNGNGLLIADSSGTVHLWNSITDTLVNMLSTGQDIAQAVFSPDNSLVALQVRDSVEIWNILTSRHTATIQVGWMLDLAWNTEWLASSNKDGITIWNNETWQPIETQSYPGGIFDLEWSPDGSQLAYVDKGSLEIIQIASISP